LTSFFSLFLLCAVLSTTLFSAGLSQWLEDRTGETELKQQIVAISSEISQRRLDTRDMVPIAHTDVTPYGVNVFLEQEVEDWKLQRSMEMIRDAGARWIRLHVPWADVEIPAKGGYVGPNGKSTWEKYDRIVELAEQYGVNILARLDDPPDWSRADNSVHNRPPDNFDDYGDFVSAFVGRYEGRITYYQIWNEPNVYPEWGNQPADASAYVELLKTAYLRAKEANPASVIVAAPLSPTLGTPDGMNESDLTFLQKMYDAGANWYFDIMAVNAYGLWTGPGDRRVEAARTNFSRPILIREIMVRNGDASKAVWATEMGWNALPDDFPGPATHGRVSLERQASYTAEAYRRAQEEWPWMGVIFYWQFRMVADEPNQIAYYYRMVNPDFTTLPVFDAYRRMAHEPGTLDYGYHEHDHWVLTYRGPWSIQQNSGTVAGSFSRATDAGATLSFSFKGTGLRIAVPQTATDGRAYVTLDGYSPSSLPRDEQGRAYVDLATTGPRDTGTITLAGTLPYGQYNIEMTVASPGFAIEAVIVERNDTDWWRVSGGAALLVTCLVVLVWAFSRR